MAKNILSLALLFIAAIFVGNYTKADEAHTFFVPRQTTMNSVFELGLNNYDWYHNRFIDDSCTFGFYATPFFQQSTKGSDRARYFFPCNKECLVFNEINHDTSAIESLWFNVMSNVNTNLSNTFSMSPRRQAYGSYFNLYIAKEWDSSSMWLSVSMAAMKVEHALRMCETKSEENGPLSNFELGSINEFNSITSALANPDWCFGKFCCSSLKRSGVDDIQLKLGYDWYYNNDEDKLTNRNHVSPYIVGTIPTGQRQRSTYIFEPLVGSKNGSFGMGANADYTLCAKEKNTLTWLMDFKWRYAFGADQCRSFDLCKNGDWSRYLLVVPSDQVLNTQQAINVLTFNTKVTPGNTIEAWTALNWDRNNCNIELGYNFWWRQKESIKVKECLASDYGIFDIAGASSIPKSASCATISQGPLEPNQAISDSEFISLTMADINAHSAAHPAAMSSTVYLAADWNCHHSSNSTLFGVGGQYEFAHNRAALDQWALWAKLGLTF